MELLEDPQDIYEYEGHRVKLPETGIEVDLHTLEISDCDYEFTDKCHEVRCRLRGDIPTQEVDQFCQYEETPEKNVLSPLCDYVGEGYTIRLTTPFSDDSEGIKFPADAAKRQTEKMLKHLDEYLKAEIAQ